ncbi:MAG TPA: PilZ domain-containing protein [Beijerinckiaceae bacterium]|jgi:hypothetical protein
MSDTERSPRVRTMLGAKLVYANGRMSAPCTIRNMSSTGAKIMLEGALPLPQDFELFVPQKNLKLNARLVWRNGLEIGVSFVAAEAPEPPPATDAERLRAENLRLKREVAELRARLDSYNEGAI